MKKKIEVTAKKVADAIAEGLKILQLTIDDVDVKILSSGGLFKKSVIELYYGEDLPEPIAAPIPEVKKEVKKDVVKDVKPIISPEAAKENKHVISPIINREIKPFITPETKKEVKPTALEVKKFERPIEEKRQQKPFERMGKTPEVVDRTEKSGKRYKTHESNAPTVEQLNGGKEYLANIIRLMNVEGTVEAVATDGADYNIVTQNSKIIGYRGEVLDSLQYLTSLKVNENSEKYCRVKLDGLDYRAKRKGILENLAVKLAEKCVRTGKRVSVDPMDSMDRRIIHAKLADNLDVITKSEGKEPSRRVVIYLRNEQK